MKENIYFLKKEFSKIKNKGWVIARSKGNGNVGITFETLLGKERENFPISDYMGIELKTSIDNYSRPYLTLFSATPDGKYIYTTKLLKEIGGWKNCVGEDIVLTWELLSKGYETNFAQNSIAFTEVPENYKDLARQRKRWARGMIEAFKRVKTITSKKLNLKSKFLMCLNIFFPFVDLALLIFIPLGLILLIFGNQLLIGWLTLFVIFLGILLCLIIDIKRKAMLKELGYKSERRSLLAFIFYILLYAFILAPHCLIGYISELINYKKEW